GILSIGRAQDGIRSTTNIGLSLCGSLPCKVLCGCHRRSSLGSGLTSEVLHSSNCRTPVQGLLFEVRTSETTAYSVRPLSRCKLGSRISFLFEDLFELFNGDGGSLRLLLRRQLVGGGGTDSGRYGRRSVL